MKNKAMYTNEGEGVRRAEADTLPPRHCLCTSPCSSHFRLGESSEYPISLRLPNVGVDRRKRIPDTVSKVLSALG